MALFEETAEAQLFDPVFITDHPVDVSPLAKQRPDDPRFTERFELYIAGMEIANAFSELNDPDVQAERFRQQVAAREAGDAEAHLFDADYVRALEHAMPPAAGNGIGIDRLTMLMTDRQSIRDVILFPLMRPEAEVSRRLFLRQLRLFRLQKGFCRRKSPVSPTQRPFPSRIDQLAQEETRGSRHKTLLRRQKPSSSSLLGFCRRQRASPERKRPFARAIDRPWTPHA